MNRSNLILPVFVLMVFLIGVGNAAPLEEYGDRIYEPELQLNFPRDANLAHSLGFEQTYGINGFMVYNDALRFIRFLNNQAYLGTTNWRLPTIDELRHLYHVDGVAWVYGDPSAAEPFENLGAMYWAQNIKSFDFFNGEDLSFAAYRHVLPVANWRAWPSFRPPKPPLPLHPYPYPAPWLRPFPGYWP